MQHFTRVQIQIPRSTDENSCINVLKRVQIIRGTLRTRTYLYLFTKPSPGFQLDPNDSLVPLIVKQLDDFHNTVSKGHVENEVSRVHRECRANS